MSVLPLLLVATGFLAQHVRRGWLAVPLVFMSTPVIFTLIGAFDDGESWRRRTALGAIFAALTGIGWVLGFVLGRRRAGRSPALNGQSVS